MKPGLWMLLREAAPRVERALGRLRPEQVAAGIGGREPVLGCRWRH